METLPIYELHKICRICLKTDLLVSIFSPTFLVRPIEMIEKLHIFQTDDNLPTLLCQSCLYRLLDAYNLQQLAEASERHLREYLGADSAGAISGAALNLNTINQETSSFPLTAATQLDTSKDDTISFDVLNDVEIDVSSLTRSEAADDDDTLSEVFVGGGGIGCSYETQAFADGVQSNDLGKIVCSNGNVEKKTAVMKGRRHKRTGKFFKTPDKCFECGKIFSYTGYLEAHKRTHSGNKPFQCQLCSRRFSQSSNLLLHQRTHTGERRYQCEICANFFTTSSNLKAHRLTHSERRDFRCAQCERSFKSIRELRRHTPVHKTIKDFVCDMCEKAFTKSSYLAAHRAAIHRGIRRHKCVECNKVFGSRSNLVCHMRIHSGEKPFQCKYCSWKFNQSSTLVRHMKQHLKSTTIELNTIKNNEVAANNNEHLINNFLHHSNTELMETNTHSPNFSILHCSANISSGDGGILHMNSALMNEAGLTAAAGNDSTLSTSTNSTLQAYDFTKGGILDFSTSTQHQQQSNLY